MRQKPLVFNSQHPEMRVAALEAELAQLKPILMGLLQLTPRTQGSKLWINPLMSLYWCFRLPQVADRIIYLDAIKQTDSYMDVLFLIEEVQSGRKTLRRWEDIPV